MKIKNGFGNCKRLKPVLLLVLLIFSNKISGLEYPVQFKQMRLEPGESTTNIYTITQDSTGFLWIGSTRGLFKYDGYQITKIPIRSNNNLVRYLKVDDHNNIWFRSTHNILEKYDIYLDSLIQYDLSDSINKAISCFIFDKDTIWLAASSQGIYKYVPDSNRLQKIKIDLCHTKQCLLIKTLLLDNTRLWIGTNAGLYTFNLKSKEVKQIRLANQLFTVPDEKIKSLFKYGQNLWISTVSGYIIKYDLSKDKITKIYNIFTDNSQKYSKITCMSYDRLGQLWIGTSNRGLASFDLRKEKLTFSATKPELISGIHVLHISEIFIDSSGVIWVGTTKPGLFKQCAKAKFHHYLLTTEEDSTKFENYVQAIYKDNAGYLYIGTFQDGLYIFDSENKLVHHCTHDPADPLSLSHNIIYAIIGADDHSVWLCTNRGLDRYSLKTNQFSHYTLSDQDLLPILSNLEKKRRSFFSEKSRRFRCIYPDDNQNLWIGTSSGILAYFNVNTTKFSVYRKNASDWQSPDAIISMEKDQFGNLWLGTVFDGIYIFNPRKKVYESFFKSALHPDSLSSNLIRCIYKDNQNLMWIGTNRHGISVYDFRTEKFKTYMDVNGIPSNKISGIMEDDRSNIWISTDHGLSKFNRDTGLFTNYTDKDGINYHQTYYIAHDFHETSSPSLGKFIISSNKASLYSCSFKSTDGYIYFGGNNGYIVFNPDNFQSEKNLSATLALTDFKIFNVSQTSYRPFYLIDNIKLSYKDYIFSFAVSYLDYHDPKSNKYLHMLEGFEKNWSEPTNDRTITYWNIPPGNYQLKIKAYSKYGCGTSAEKKINITITPPFWKTWWFRAIIVLTLVGIVGFIFWLRISSIQKQKKLLEIQVRERTAELHESNEKLIEEIRFRKKAEEELRKSEEEYRDLFENAYDVIWICDMSGKIQAINRFFQNLLGYSKDELIGTYLLDYISREHRFRAIRNYLKFQRDQLIECELNFKTRDNDIRILWLKVRGIYENGGIVGIHGIGRDSTELKKAQAELREAERMKRESMKQLTLKLAHEIKNPLTSITSSAQLVAASKDARENQKIQRHMNIINKNVNICNQVIRELYAFTHKPKMNFTVIQISDLINDLYRYAESKTEHNPKIKIVTTNGDARAAISGDKFRLEQAFTNLINNAVDAMAGEGTLTINAHSVNNTIYIEISDTGCGMSAETLQNLYKPFFTSKASGFGLGMPVVKDIIDAHQGTIHVESDPDRGTTFRISFKAHYPDERKKR